MSDTSDDTLNLHNINHIRPKNDKYGAIQNFVRGIFTFCHFRAGNVANHRLPGDKLVTPQNSLLSRISGAKKGALASALSVLGSLFSVFG